MLKLYIKEFGSKYPVACIGETLTFGKNSFILSDMLTSAEYLYDTYSVVEVQSNS